MSRIPAPARTRYHQEMRAAKTAIATEERWAHLERAHILSQPDPWLHTRNHVAMFALAVRQRDRREALGQIVRIVVAAPGSLSGHSPAGNTGRADAGLRQVMPIPTDLDALLHPTTTARHR
ncbi:DUF3703 domain-containing protein [Nocardia cyriacigeorgica]|uniref:DUF3703 domain-containing protein n=1 Tax=Nocardia cyriacigeorgica TaxID=135487 RepID=A0A6P1D9N3_9NOCA|nr:DUF3703 domain-containing protein [Nocardia cyriacigeorgica]NEW37560.1 DUF3703 domain-containing protein [Nocardia cyriacigeorgica]NEW45002.1 DUF3703 domain-containing protein [Nocardia cyriacigeorgica]NEW55153.1 DUF3703 domain-containing protein [Nocardia cyriacigeorgica]